MGRARRSSGERGGQVAAAPSAPQHGSEYAELSRLVREAGLLERRPGYYAWKIPVTAGLLAAGWVVFVAVGNSWWQLAVAAFLAVIFTQVGFLGHDAGDRQVFGSRRASCVAGVLLGNPAPFAGVVFPGGEPAVPGQQRRRCYQKTSAQRCRGMNRVSTANQARSAGR